MTEYSDTLNIRKRLVKFLKIPSVVGFEQPFMDYLYTYCQKYTDYTITQTNILIVVQRKESTSKKILSVHVDRQGFVVNAQGVVEYAAFVAKKKHGIIIEADEYVFKKSASRYIGEEIYAYDHLSGKELSRGKIVGSHYNMKKELVTYDVEGISNLSEGMPLALVSTLHTQKNYIYSQIDNAISVALAIELLEEGFDGIILFTTEEEIGLSWKHIANYLEEQKITTQELIVLDTSPYKYVHSLDKGLVVLRNRDETGVFNKELLQKIIVICGKEKIPFELKDELKDVQNEYRASHGLERRSYGHTELGRLVEHTKGKVNGATIQIPSTNYHTNEELTSLESLENYYLFLKKLVL